MTRARDVANWLPTGGNPGDVLVKASADDYDYTYKNIGAGLPSFEPEDQGKALVISPALEAEWGARLQPVFPENQTIDCGEDLSP